MNWAVLVAGGRGTRMALPENKVFLPLGGEPMLTLSLRALLDSGAFGGVTVVAGSGETSRAEALAAGCAPAGAPAPVLVVEGGEDRQASVWNGLATLPPEAECVAVHDAARPLVTSAVIEACLASAREWGSGVAAVPLKDTVKQVDENGAVLDTPPRAQLRAVQTPQAFRTPLLREAHERALRAGLRATDDAALVEALCGVPVRLVDGDSENIKVTTPEDVAVAEALLARRNAGGPVQTFRIGQGYDVHELAEGRALILCGVRVPHERGLLGHSDADVAAHALCDALLGAAGLGDIGRHFPDTDPAYAGADSLLLLAEAARKAAAAGYAVGNADVTIVAQRPKLMAYMPRMADNLARALGVARDAVNVKATTTEGLGFEGGELGISAQAAVLLVRKFGP